MANKRAYGLGGLVGVFPDPVVSNRAPVASDRLEAGRIWVNTAAGGGVYINRGVIAGAADWVNSGAGAGVFDSLQVTIGPVDIDTTDAAGVTVDAVGGPISLDSDTASNFTVTGAGTDLTLASGAGRVVVNGEEAAADAIRLLSAAGGIDADCALQMNLSSSQAAADSIVINASDAAGGVDISTGGGSIDLASAGSVTVQAATDSQASPTATATINANVGAATFTGFMTASGADQEFTITNSVATATSQIFVTASNEGLNDAQMTVFRVNRAAGSFVVTLVNNGAAALNGDVTITFWIIG